MASHHPVPSIAVTSGEDPPPNPRHHDIHRRVFIGPMPEKVISQTEAHIKKRKDKQSSHSSSNEGGDDVPEIIKQNAFAFFVHHGGRPEDWGDEEEHNVVEEMLQRWRNSEWGSIWRHRRQKKHVSSNRDHQWVGGSFEIGRLLGVSIAQDSDNLKERLSTAGSSVRRVPVSASSTTYDEPQNTASSMGQETFVTAPSHSNLLSPIKNNVGTPEASTSNSVGVSLPASSSTSLLRPALERISNGPKVQTEIVPRPRPIINVPSVAALSDGVLHLSRKKAKVVHYADTDVHTEEPPAPPSEVLERTEHSLQDTSAGAAAAAAPTPSSPNLNWGDVVMRGNRMLIRTCYTRVDTISPKFDESQHRTTRDLLDADWGEYMVAWRKDCLELYSDYRLPVKEWLTGHKQLSFVIPLKSSKTQLSLYSFVDLTFCITCVPVRPVHDDSKKRWFFHRQKEGTNIFIFKLKSRSRAYDWIWQLWQILGGQLPETLEVRNPRLNTRVKIDIPLADADQLSRTFDRENTISLCMDSLQSVPDWKALIEREIKAGKSLELAWRVGTNLDWIWLDEGVDGQERRWGVLCGLALKQAVQPAVLEIRLAEHYPSYVHLKNGSRLHEPPAIEGYVERIRPNSQTRQGLYLSTHDNNLFVMTRNRAYPPAPPGLVQSDEDVETYTENLSKSEVQRGAMQILHATGVNDLRNILLIRRASHPTPEATHKEAVKSQESDIWFGIWSQSEERAASDDEDEGGEEGLSKADDKPRLKMRRCFELLLTTGRVIRFETHSCRVAVEWIERLRALVLYWKQRLRIDAKEEMDLAQSLRPRLTPLTRATHDDSEYPPEAPADLSAPMPALGTLYNWCVLDGCKSVIKGGRVYVRKGLYGQYKLVQLFLAAGHLTQFHIAPNTSLHASMRRKTNLIDGYVCSGYLAAMALPKGQYRASANADPRRYQDGLETDDPEEDMLFMVWYRPQSKKMMNPSTIDEPLSATPNNIPSLSARRKCLVFRTRSKLERDAWCWALNCEIERLTRTQKDWEVKLRETGSLLTL